MKEKKFVANRFSKMDSQSVLEAKQQIAIEKYGEIFEDQVFFELEMTINEELASELNKEYNKRFNRNKRLN